MSDCGKQMTQAETVSARKDRQREMMRILEVQVKAGKIPPACIEYDVLTDGYLGDRMFLGKLADGGPSMSTSANSGSYLIPPVGEDPETQRIIMGLFTRNLRGMPMHKSQFGGEYREFKAGISPEVEEALGTQKARDCLRRSLIVALRPYTPSIAVWRHWPEIERCPTNHAVSLKIYARLHCMTEEDYGAFVQDGGTTP